MDFAVLLLFLTAIAVGVVSAVVKTWTLRATLLELQDRVSVLEGVTTREVKIRASNSRKNMVNESDRLMEELKKPVEVKPVRNNWWEVNLPRKVS